MKYSDKVKLDAKGNLHINTAFGDLIEHAPKTFYEKNNDAIIPSAFLKSGKIISFQLAPYDKNRDVTIDPWVQTPAIANSNCVWECEKDGSGNVYIIGGDSPMKLLKYNAAGSLQWTFITNYDTSSSTYAWLGTLATDLAGNSYVTCGSTASLTKVNSSGSQVYSVAGGSTDEYWNIAFNCDQTKLIIGGTRLNAFPTIKGYGTIFDINTANGSVNSSLNVGYTSPGGFGVSNPDEVRSITSSYNARYYYLTLDSMGAIDQNFSACPNANSLFKINDGYAFSYKCENYRPKNGNAGIMAIRANKNFVYTQNGKTIQKRSLMNGSILATATIPGGISTSNLGTNQVGNSGIDIDSCGNVYVGSGNALVQYDANLNQLASVSLPFAVYDVAVSYGGMVIVSGSTGTSASTSRTGYVQSISMSACNPIKLLCCDATICPAGPFCTTSPSFTLSPVTAGGSWSGTGVNASGVFNPSTAGAGVHTVIYTLACGSDSIQITVNPCATLTVCQSGGNLNVSGGTAPYTWYTTTTYSNCSACFFPAACAPAIPGTCPVISTSLTPSFTNTASITTPSSNYPVVVTDNAGNSYTITTSAAVPSCSACVTPALSIVSSTSVNCYGGATGSASVTASPNGIYTYTWQPGNLSGASQSGLTAGVYTVTGSSGSSCTNTLSIPITQPASALSASITANTPASCGQNNGSLTVSASGGTAGYTYSWTPSGGTASSAGNLAGGNYTVFVTDANSCASSGTATITTTTNPVLSVNSVTLCAGYTDTLRVSGASSYTWAPATGLNTTTGSTVITSPSVTQVYTVSGTAGTCSASATATVTVISILGITATSATICAGATATLTANGASNYTWTPTAGLSNSHTASVVASPSTTTSYTVNGNIGSCTANPAVVQVLVNPVPSLSITPAAAAICAGDSVSLHVSGATSYSWMPATGLSTSTASLVVASPSLTTTYTIIGWQNNCPGIISVPVQINPLPVFTVASASICAGNATLLTASGNASTYSWSPATGLSSSSGISVTANPTSSETYTITGSLNSCTATTTASVNVVPNPTLSVSSFSLCAGSTGTLQVSGNAALYDWSTGTNPVTGTVVNVSPSGNTSYTVTGSISTCSATAVATVSVSALPVVKAGPDSTICKGDTVHLHATGATTYNWIPPAGLSNSGISNPMANPSASTNYTVMGTDAATGCKNTAIVTISTSTLQAVLSANPISGDAPLSVNFTANTGAASYYWNYGNGTSLIGLTDSSKTLYTNPGTYTASVYEISAAGCKDSARITIIVNEGYAIVIPNIMTPNDDGTNDYFFVKHEGISALNMTIYDRWGILMWQSTALNGTWDGKHNGSDVPDGVYFYLIKATDNKGSSKDYKGPLTLIR